MERDGNTCKEPGHKSSEAAPAPHPWAGTWDLHSNEACATGACKDPLCRAVIPGVCITARDGVLSATHFSLKALEDPMSEDPFSYPDPAYLTYEQAAAAGGASFVWHGDDTGCGVRDVQAALYGRPGGWRRASAHRTAAL